MRVLFWLHRVRLQCTATDQIWPGVVRIGDITETLTVSSPVVLKVTHPQSCSLDINNDRNYTRASPSFT